MRALHESEFFEDQSERPTDTAECSLDASEVARLTKEASYIVGMMARRYVSRGVPYEDLVAAGNVGLVVAAHKFDPQRGVQFSSYAAWWVRKEIVETLWEGHRMIRVPRYASEIKRRILEFGDAGFSDRQVRRAGEAFVAVVSLDSSRDDESPALGERIADPRATEQLESVEFGDAMLSMERAMATLRPRERAVVELRYGIGGAEPLRLIDVAARLGLSRERIRQIQADALGRLRKALGATRSVDKVAFGK